jgi:hypothetical protein
MAGPRLRLTDWEILRLQQRASRFGVGEYGKGQEDKIANGPFGLRFQKVRFEKSNF